VAKEENADLDPAVVLMFGVRDSARLDYAVYDTRPIPPPSAPANSLDAVYVSCYYSSLLLTQFRVGTWNLVAFWGQNAEVSRASMIRLDLILSRPSAEGHSMLSASGMNMYGDSLVVQGQVLGGSETPIISFSIKVGGYSIEYYHGPIDTDGASSVITFGYSANPSEHTGVAVISRTAENILRLRPSPKAFRDNKYRTLWEYAIKAARDDVRRKSFSSLYIAERRSDRQRFLDLAKRGGYCGRPLNSKESDELHHITQRLRWMDARFYMSIIQFDLQENPNHRYGLYQMPPRTHLTMISFRPITCDSCGGYVGG
jgi:hypothetical protein